MSTYLMDIFSKIPKIPHPEGVAKSPEVPYTYYYE